MIIDNHNILGESPIWNHMNNTFYWVDICDKKIKSMNDYKIMEYDIIKSPTCLFLKDINNIVITLEDGIGVYDFRINKFNYLTKINDKNVRFNDGKCDKNGVIHIGTMDRLEKNQIGSIYKYVNNEFIEIKNSIGISNGISFSKNNKMYYSDSLTKKIYTLENNNEKLLYKYDNSSPDGSTIDIQDNYYSCLWEGSSIDIFNNKDDLIHKIDLPFLCPTCCCFGGENLNKLLITSSSLINNSYHNGKLCLLNDINTGIKEPIALI